MKLKFIALILAILFVIPSCVACTIKVEYSSDDTPDTAETDKKEDNDTEASTEKTEETEPTVSGDDVLFSESGVTLHIKNAYVWNSSTVAINYSLENNSGKTISVILPCLYAMGYTIPTGSVNMSNIADGETTEGEIKYDTSSLRHTLILGGINSITSIGMDVTIYSDIDGDGKTDFTTSDAIIYKSNGIIEYMLEEPVNVDDGSEIAEGFLAFENEYIKFYALGIDEDYAQLTSDPVFYFRCENISDKKLDVSFDKQIESIAESLEKINDYFCAVNGVQVEIEPFDGTVYPGTSRIIAIQMHVSDAGISAEEIETFNMAFKVQDTNVYTVAQFTVDLTAG